MKKLLAGIVLLLCSLAAEAETGWIASHSICSATAGTQLAAAELFAAQYPECGGYASGISFEVISCNGSAACTLQENPSGGQFQIRVVPYTVGINSNYSPTNVYVSYNFLGL